MSPAGVDAWRRAKRLRLPLVERQPQGCTQAAASAARQQGGNGAPPRWRYRIGAGLAAVLAVFPLATGAAPRVETAESAIVVKSELIAAFEPGNPSRKRFGGLEFRGGLVLTSPSPVFGGLSALRVSADGDLVAVTDHGNWLTARLVYDGSRPVGLTNAVMAPILGADGRPLAARGWYDTESLTADDGTFYIGIERVHQIVRLDFARDGIHARAQPIAVPAAFARLPDNKGIECLAFVPRPHSLHGTLIAISERGLDASGNIQGFLIGGPKPGEFTVRRRDDFDISDCALAPDGALFLLERKFSWATGVQIRIRRVNIADVAPGALVDGREILNADMTFQIDNMEGLSLHRAKDGRVIMTLISDDNFSILQRTLLLQFALVEPQSP